MKLVTPVLEVNNSDGFEKDVLNRERFGKALTNLIASSTEELVISLDGHWGEGKTTFVKMWQGHLQERKIASIYIDAFEIDYTDDAFLSIASAITSYETQNSINVSSKNTDFKENAKKMGIHLFSWATKIAVKTTTLGIIDTADVDILKEGINKDIATDASNTLATFIDERLSSHSKEIELIKRFRLSLSKLPTTLKNNSSNRLVIIIDELDRCKPTFAVEILEKIKHLFSVKNITFVLVMHKQQLEEAIKCVYGNGIDASTYLQKFINIETFIPKKVSGEKGQFNTDIEAYIRQLIVLHDMASTEGMAIIDSLSPLAQHFSLSLRQLEKIFTNIAIIYSTLEENYPKIFEVIVFVSVVKLVDPGLFRRIQQRKISYEDLCKKLAIHEPIEKTRAERGLISVMYWVQLSLLSSSEYKDIDGNHPIRQLGSDLEKCPDVNRKDILPLHCQRLSMFFVN